jgi:hypothetical protein
MPSKLQAISNARNDRFRSQKRAALQLCLILRDTSASSAATANYAGHSHGQRPEHQIISPMGIGPVY